MKQTTKKSWALYELVNNTITYVETVSSLVTIPGERIEVGEEGIAIKGDNVLLFAIRNRPGIPPALRFANNRDEDVLRKLAESLQVSDMPSENKLFFKPEV
jgi:hypothetical protein